MHRLLYGSIIFKKIEKSFIWIENGSGIIFFPKKNSLKQHLKLYIFIISYLPFISVVKKCICSPKILKADRHYFELLNCWIQNWKHCSSNLFRRRWLRWKHQRKSETLPSEFDSKSNYKNFFFQLNSTGHSAEATLTVEALLS